MRRAFCYVTAALVAAGCVTRPAQPPLPPGTGTRDAAVYESCTSICLRPGDCAVAYSSGDLCPPGFLCALRFSCASDGGHD